MDFGNETPSFECRFLDESYFEVLLEKVVQKNKTFSSKLSINEVRHMLVFLPSHHLQSSVTITKIYSRSPQP